MKEGEIHESAIVKKLRYGCSYRIDGDEIVVYFRNGNWISFSPVNRQDLLKRGYSENFYDLFKRGMVGRFFNRKEYLDLKLKIIGSYSIERLDSIDNSSIKEDIQTTKEQKC
jgi:hypothetical protein